MDKLAHIFALVTSLLLAACGGGGGGGGGGTASSNEGEFCADLQSRQNFVSLMQDVYLWYDRLPTVNLDDNRYCSLENLLEDLRYKAEDRFSRIHPRSTAENFFIQGQYHGFGYGAQTSTGEDPTVTFVYKNSPAYRSGVRRGDRFLSINGRDTSSMSGDDFFPLLRSIRNGQPTTFVFRSPGGSPRTLVFSSATVTVNTVLDARVVDSNGFKVGYLSFNSFIRPSEDELEIVFANFKAAGIDELVLDLRYNGGGLISVAAKLASLTAGQVVDGSVFTSLRYNDKQIQNNRNYVFERQLESLDHLNRVIVLTRFVTCSASELIINGLRPWLGNASIVTIGGTTCGKPFGSSNLLFTATGTNGSSQEYSVSAITFRAVNRDEQGGYINGIAANCAANDDVDRQLGDSAERMFSAALAYINSGTCAAARQKNQIGTYIPPYRLNNAF